MLARHDDSLSDLEKSLFSAIKTHHADTANDLIQIILKYTDVPRPQLQGIYQDGKNLLMIALETKQPDLFLSILRHLENTDVMFESDKDKKTIFMLAIELNYARIIEKLIACSETRLPNIAGYKVWLQRNAYGMTPLHLATQNSYDAFILILNKVLLESNSEQLINATDQSGNTPLHCAMLNLLAHNGEEDPSIIIVAELLSKGADLHIPNNLKHSPIEYFLCIEIQTPGRNISSTR